MVAAGSLEEWVSSLGIGDSSDPGTPTAGVMEFLRALHAERGPMAVEDVGLALRERQVELAREAVALVGADVHATTDLDPPPFEYRIDEGGVRIAYWGQFATSPIVGLTAEGVAAEVSDFMQDEIMEDLHSAWPTCPEHQNGAYAAFVDGRAVWHCRKHQHIVATVGRLAC